LKWRSENPGSRDRPILLAPLEILLGKAEERILAVPGKIGIMERREAIEANEGLK